MSTLLNIGKDNTGTDSDTVAISENNYTIVLAAGVPTSITVPQNVDRAYFAFGGGGDVWVDFDGTATIPGASFTQSTLQLNPVSRFVLPGNTISFVCMTANGVQVAFYNVSVRWS
jgi:hypothetical protein